MLASTVENSIAQQEVQVCSCSPPEYRWRLNFSRGCPLEISPPKGTKDKYCDEVDKSQGFNGDVTPVRVTDITLIELDTDLIAIKNIQQTNTTLVNGDSITFESLSTVGVITGGFQGEFRAVNAAGQSFTLEFLVRFSNLCEVLPFSVGDSLGYLEFTDIVQPRADACNYKSASPSLVPTVMPSIYPTDKPSASPTKSPTLAPTRSPTAPPTKKGSEFPSSSPTRGPTSSPTKYHSGMPSSDPTKGPTSSPTEDLDSEAPSSPPTKGATSSPTKFHSGIPSSDPTKSPTSTPTKSPTRSPTGTPTKSPTKNPTKSPTEVPTKSPTKNPTKSPTKLPTKSATTNPTSSPTKSPTYPPIDGRTTPTPMPTHVDTVGPIESNNPSPAPSILETDVPSPLKTIECYGKAKGKNYLRKKKGKGKGKEYNEYIDNPTLAPVESPLTEYTEYSTESYEYGKGKGKGKKKDKKKKDKKKKDGKGKVKKKFKGKKCITEVIEPVIEKGLHLREVVLGVIDNATHSGGLRGLKEEDNSIPTKQ